MAIRLEIVFTNGATAVHVLPPDVKAKFIEPHMHIASRGGQWVEFMDESGDMIHINMSHALAYSIIYA